MTTPNSQIHEPNDAARSGVGAPSRKRGLRRVRRVRGVRVGTTLASFVTAGLALAAVAAGPALAQQAPPAQSPAQAPASSPDRDSAASVAIADPDDLLSASDEETLRAETPRIALPPQVREVSYIVVDGADEDFNDFVKDWSAEHRPELVPDGTGEGAKWAPGQLIVAVSMGERKNGIYCGDDVCSALDLFEGPHLDRSVDEMKPALGDERANIPVGLLDGVRTAADPSLVAEDNGPSGAEIGAIAGGIGALAVGGFGVAYGYSRKKATAAAREQFDHVSREYGSVAQRLDEIDIRAHSLSSPIADAEMRRQWEKVRDEFGELGDAVGRTGLTLDSPNSAFYSHRKEIGEAHAAVENIENAEANIEKVFAMEHGDAAVRHSELSELIEDIVEAQNSGDRRDAELTRRLGELERQAISLRAHLDDPDFMDRFSEILRSYGHLLEIVREKEMPELETGSDRHAPRIYESDYRVGYGYGGWVPFVYLSSWHSADMQVASSASGSGSANTSFSGGFSGGGGSSSF